MGFVNSQLAIGRKNRVVTVVDPRFSTRAKTVLELNDEVCTRIGDPKTIRVDPGPEFVSWDLDLRV
jgi:putative transposase